MAENSGGELGDLFAGISEAMGMLPFDQVGEALTRAEQALGILATTGAGSDYLMGAPKDNIEESARIFRETLELLENARQEAATYVENLGGEL